MSRRARRWAAAVLIAPAFLVVACGDSGDDASSSGGASTTTTSPSTTSAPTTTAPLPKPSRALVLGDSFIFDAAPAVQAGLEAAGLDVHAEPIFGFGLNKRDYYDWQAQYPRLVREYKPDVVLMFSGAFDLGDQQVNGETLVAGSPEWQTWFEGLAEDVVELLTADGARLYWLTSPHYRIPGTDDAVAALNDLLHDLDERHDDLEIIEAGSTLDGPQGGFTPTLPGTDGTPERVRKDDGVHLCPPGAERFARAAVDALADDYDLTVQAGWESGPWRTDQRYVMGIEGGTSA